MSWPYLALASVLTDGNGRPPKLKTDANGRTPSLKTDANGRNLQVLCCALTSSARKKTDINQCIYWELNLREEFHRPGCKPLDQLPYLLCDNPGRYLRGSCPKKIGRYLRGSCPKKSLEFLMQQKNGRKRTPPRTENRRKRTPLQTQMDANGRIAT